MSSFSRLASDLDNNGLLVEGLTIFGLTNRGRVVLNTSADMDAANSIEDIMSEPLEIHWTGKSGTKYLFWIFWRGTTFKERVICALLTVWSSQLLELTILQPQSKILFGQPGRL